MRKHNFTIIEIVICLVILATIGGLATTYGFQTYKQAAFDRERERLKDEMLLTKVLATTHQMDITLHFTKKNNTLVLMRTADYVPSKVRSYFNHPIHFPSLKLQEEKTYTWYSNNPTSFEFPTELYSK